MNTFRWTLNLVIFLFQGSHVSKQLATSNALAGLGSHLKLSLYQLRLQAISIENEGDYIHDLSLWKIFGHEVQRCI